MYPLLLLTATAIGASFGSAANVAITRIPEERSLWWPPSACGVCEAPIRWYDNVPVFGWLALRGRCRDCGAPIAAFHPVVEALGAALGWLVFRRFVPGLGAVDLPHFAAAGVYFGFCWLLVIAALVDLRSRIIPEMSSLYAIPAGIVACTALEAVGYRGWLAVGWQASVLGACVGGGALGLMSIAWRLVLGREGLGWGDVRLVAMIGAFVGPLPGLWLVLLLASVLGALAGISAALLARGSVYLPFGPSLALAAMTYVLYGDVLVRHLLPGWR
ncbi:MAG TPA: prepilin peptidase [Myxococcota bacterium]|nr:prepilin peptidase [Myxococcota bacterium]